MRIEVLDNAGRVIDTDELGAMASGRHSFDWTPSAGVDADPGRALSRRGHARHHRRDRHAATPATASRRSASAPTALMLELAHAGPVTYDKVKAFD